MAGGAAVVAALGAIAELGLPLSVTGVVPACENMLSGSAMRPTDVVTTAAGLTVEVTNPDAEGRLILADALWYARREGATHLVDLATLTGALRAGMGDVYAGVFGADESWRDVVVQAGNASGDLAWPWPLHPRYRPLIQSTVADLRNTAGELRLPDRRGNVPGAVRRSGTVGPRRHAGPALLDEDRGDAFGRGATGYGVRMLVELATRMSAEAAVCETAQALRWRDERRRSRSREERPWPRLGVSSTPPSSTSQPRSEPRWSCCARSAPTSTPRIWSGTPRRVAASFAELVTPAEFAATSFPNEGRYDELVLVRDIPFHTLCMHHLLPFHGQAHVAYLPGERIIGISKLARVVENVRP